MLTDLVPVTAEAVPSYEMITLPPADAIRRQLVEVRAFQKVVKELFVEGLDYGVIPGTGNKPTLFKPGSEKLIKLLSLADTYEFAEKVEDWQAPFFNFTVLCRLRSMTTGVIVAEGLGNCNSYESKYRYRWLWPNDIPESERAGLKTKTFKTKNGSMVTQYRIENDDIFSLVNTLIKMACKRAQMAAALSAGRLSEIFTQDLEDLADNGVINQEPLQQQPSQNVRQSSNGNGQGTRSAPPPTNVEHITDETDPRWVYWETLASTASALGIRPAVLEIPLALPSYQAAKGSVMNLIVKKGGSIPPGDPEVIAILAEDRSDPPEPDQEAIPFD